MIKKQRGISLLRKRKINIFFLFFLLALIFSILTKLSTDYTQTISFTVEASHIPEDKVIIKDSIQKLNITLTTYGFKLIRYQLSEPSIEINIDRLDKDDHYFIWTEHKEFANIVAQFDANVKIDNINPDTLKLRYDTNAVKKIPVILNSKIKFSPGYDLLNSFAITPDSVKVIGPKIVIDAISEVQTDTLEQIEVNKDISTSVALQISGNDQITYSQNKVKVEGRVDRFTEGSVSVPVIVKNVPENVNLKIYPKSIDVIYYASLEDFKNIGPNSFIVACDYKDVLQEESSYLTPIIIQQPEFIKGVRLNLKRIEFFITK
ncbi:MAG: YbbR-like domain-containing protein [Bacteroidia bacterium]|nr:YbbR-like domain-containing protein [Bacteroidia bacterium]MBT8278104.1 YbbR-like domain-containing protein [Bacteroidia bacterium]NND26792.1 YbbR-like domain-containing protein [Flavobacteriaceae bacterium]NNK60330.1 YbbR-like domain-containing protein [Flavobacteriaceae bacterium]NNL33697.1 YbbR-like domain-containing protein [Flavobacteriaceae bacterium]